jgi:hypothetical protein
MVLLTFLEYLSRREEDWQLKQNPSPFFFSSVDMPATWIETNVETDSTKPCNQKQAVHIPSPCI